MAHVLIGFAEALPAPEVYFSLHAAGHRMSVFTRAGANPPLARELPLENVYVLPAPETDSAGAIAALKAIYDSAGAPEFALPIDDVALWLLNAALPDGATIIGATGPQAALALDKTLQTAAAQRAGFSVLPTHVIRRPADLDGDLTFPAISRPALAVAEKAGHLAKGGVDYLREAADVRALQTRHGPDMDPLLVQPIIAGTGEGIFGMASETGITHWSGHRRLRMMNPHGSGSSACTSQVPDADLRQATERFLKEAGWRGPFMIELLRDAAGTAWFVELNGRMWGSMALARAQGLEYPAWAVEQALDPGFCPPDVPLPDRPVEARHLGRDLLHLLFVLRGPRDVFFRPGWPRFLSSLGAVLRPDRHRRAYNHDPAFPGFARKELFHMIRNAVRRR